MGRAAVGGAAGTVGPVRALAVTVRVALAGGTAALVVAMAAVAGVMGRGAVAVGGMSLEPADLLSGSSPS